MKTIQSHIAHGNQFFYVETAHGFMCSFTNNFEDVWFSNDLDTDTPIEGPDEATVQSLVDSILGRLTATDYHGTETTFTPGMEVMHCTDDGQLYPGTVKSIADGLLEITWPNGETGWETPATCYPG